MNDCDEFARHIFIAPTYNVFNSDNLFDLNNEILNRDGQLIPFHRLRAFLQENGARVHTADMLTKELKYDELVYEYYSLGLIENFEYILSKPRMKLSAFIFMEPPVVLPNLYKALPKISAIFDRVYLPNTIGNGYSLKGVDVNKLHNFYWPIPYNHVLEPYWSNAHRLKKMVVINGSHKPANRKNEQYSKRIEVMAELSRIGVVDLYGKGWDRWWSRSAMWPPYWLNRHEIAAIYKGSCKSKFDVLQNYEFCLCFENMAMHGYVTEKIFDCLYAGTIPVYVGAPNILDLIPSEVFVDGRNFQTTQEMWDYVSGMTSIEINHMRLAGRDFLQSDGAKKFFHSLETIFGL